MKKNLKIIIASATAVCVCGFAFVLFNQLAFAKTLNKKEEVKTSYVDNAKENSAGRAGEKTEELEEYKKPSYEIDLTRVSNEGEEIPDDVLAAEDAAELGAKYLWDMLEVDLNGTTVQMQYESILTTRPCWMGYFCTEFFEVEEFDTRIGIPEYSFEVDAVTGELIKIEDHMIANKIFDSGYKKAVIISQEEIDNEYKNNCNDHKEVAKKYAEECFGVKIVKAEFDRVSQIGNGFLPLPEGQEMSLSAMGSETEPETEPEVEEASVLPCLSIIVTDEAGRKYRVSVLDDIDKSIQSIEMIYPVIWQGIEDDPSYVG